MNTGTPSHRDRDELLRLVADSLTKTDGVFTAVKDLSFHGQRLFTTASVLVTLVFALVRCTVAHVLLALGESQ
jgi:hypothetical protein